MFTWLFDALTIHSGPPVDSLCLTSAVEPFTQSDQYTNSNQSVSCSTQQQEPLSITPLSLLIGLCDWVTYIDCQRITQLLDLGVTHWFPAYSSFCTSSCCVARMHRVGCLIVSMRQINSTLVGFQRVKSQLLCLLFSATTTSTTYCFPPSSNCSLAVPLVNNTIYVKSSMWIDNKQIYSVIGHI